VAESSRFSNFAARFLTVLATTSAAIGLTDASAMAAVTCDTPNVAMYHVDALAQLRRWDYASPLDGSSGWAEQSIGSGWGGVNVVSGGSGVLYTIDASGKLRWYKDNDFTGGPASWDPASGSVIGTGWGGFGTVVSGGQGVIYAVDSSGNLHWYRYLGNGSPVWASNSGTVIGSGWNAPSKIVAGGAGIIYTVDSSGGLWWYLDQDPMGGAALWANSGIGKQIGSGWSGFTGIGSMGGGVLFARDTTGRVDWYRDTDPLGGSASWANGGTGVSEGTGWNNTQLITDITGCVAS
jgi:hypothetical protein